MSIGRRWFLKAVIALPFVPLAMKVAAAVELPHHDVITTHTSFNPYDKTFDIIYATIELRSKSIADNVSKNNALLLALVEERLAVACMTDEQKASSRRRSQRYWLERDLARFRRGRSLGYSRWLDEQIFRQDHPGWDVLPVS